MARSQMHRRVPPTRKPRRAASQPSSRPRPYGSIPRWRVRALRATTLIACGRRCVYCARHLTIDGATLDHVLPRCLGGVTDLTNVVVACRACNLSKGGLSPVEFFLVHPAAAENFLRLASCVGRRLKRDARRAVSLTYAVAA